LLAAIFCRVNQGLADWVFVVVITSIVKINLAAILRLSCFYIRGRIAFRLKGERAGLYWSSFFYA